jgi:PAS domain S-box-containing protein
MNQPLDTGAPTANVHVDEAHAVQGGIYRNLVNALSAAVYTTDLEGRITLFNEPAAAMWGRRPKIGEDLWCGSWKIYNTDGTVLPHDQCPMAVALRERRSVRGEEIVVERPDGTRAFVLPHPEPLSDDSGQIVGAVNLLVDITERRTMQDALRQAEDRFRAVFGQGEIGVAQTDLEGRILVINQRYCTLLGYTADELQGRNLRELTHPEDLGKYVYDIGQLWGGDSDTITMEKRYIHKEGRVVQVRKTVSVIRNTLGVAEYTFAFAQEIAAGESRPASA